MLDPRSGKNCQYSMIDTGMAAFSVFFTKSPSFLAHQKLLNKRRGLSNCLTLFGTEKIPSDNQVRNLLDPVPPDHFDPVFIDVARDLDNRGALATLRSRRSGLNHKTLIAVDGTEYFNSFNISCPNCSSRTHNKGNDDEMVENYHMVLSAAIVTPGQVAAVPLPVEIIRPQDGSKKQDCERNAVKRWLRRIGPRLKDLEPVYLGDDLYACQPICEAIRATGGNFILTAMRSSNKTLYEELDRCHPETRDTRVTRGIRKPKKYRYSYSWQPELRIRGGEAAMPVTWICLEIHDMAAKKLTHRTAFVTDLPVSRTNVADIVACGRSRWRVENAEFNVLKKTRIQSRPELRPWREEPCLRAPCPEPPGLRDAHRLRPRGTALAEGPDSLRHTRLDVPEPAGPDRQVRVRRLEAPDAGARRRSRNPSLRRATVPVQPRPPRPPENPRKSENPEVRKTEMSY